MVRVNPLLPRPAEPVEQKKPAAAVRETAATDFKKVLAERLNSAGGLQFSRHAVERIASRKIELSREQLEQVGANVERIAAKGVRESLLVMKNLALVVNVSSRTVVTCMGGDDMRDKVFTNIDGAVIMK